MGDRSLVTRARGAAGKDLLAGSRGGGERKGYSADFKRGGSAPGSAPLPFHTLFLTVKVPLSYTFY